MTTRPSRRTPLRLALCALLGVSVITVACNTDLPTAAQIEAADVAAVTKSLGVPSASDRTVYVVDGVKTTGEEARALHPEEIASIDVRGTTDAAVTEVRIVTGKAASSSPDGEVTVINKQNNKPGTVVLRGTATPEAQPLVVLDGAIQERGADAMRSLKLNPDRIESIEVIKGPSAISSYGDAGKHGVIVITSKKP